MHLGCSTAMQALNYGIPSGYINISKKFFRNNLPSKISHNLNDQKKILEFCNETEKFNISKKIDTINLNASKNIIDRIKELKPKKSLSDTINFMILIKDFIDANFWYLKKFIIKLINSKKLITNQTMTSPIHQKMMGGIKKNEIVKNLKKLKAKNFKIKQVLINCFEIET